MRADYMMNEPVEGVTLGEMARSVTRIETVVNQLAGQMQTALGPVGELRVKQERTEKDLNEMGKKLDTLSDKLDAVRVRADRMAGGVAVVAFLSSFVPWPWKAH